MWIQSSLGDFSIVKHNSKPNHYLVRSFKLADIKKVCKELKIKQKAIIKNSAYDYPARIEIDETQFISLLSSLMISVQYTNFKGHEMRRRDKVDMAGLFDVHRILKECGD